MASKPGERRLQILQTLATMLESAARREGDHRGARGEARRLGGGALPAFREQGADVRRADRVHRDDGVLARQQDPAETEDGAAQAEQTVVMLLRFAEKNQGMTRVLIGDALVNEDERLQARINQFVRASSKRRCASRCASRRRRTRGTAMRTPTPPC